MELVELVDHMVVLVLVMGWWDVMMVCLRVIVVLWLMQGVRMNGASVAAVCAIAAWNAVAVIGGCGGGCLDVIGSGWGVVTVARGED